ncbi:hypothetical protein DFH11DRAFT_1598653 [Phellopilus nigrolimitatus]|nr:hypothetical protein DFH11DRAFT_1598653 [Phellopilus nigrolimitatus]
MIAVCLHPLLVLVTVQLSFELVAECRWPSNQCTCLGLLSIQKRDNCSLAGSMRHHDRQNRTQLQNLTARKVN